MKKITLACTVTIGMDTAPTATKSSAINTLNSVYTGALFNTFEK